MEHTIVPRSVIGVPDPGNRPKLGKVASILVHYTGVNGYKEPSKDFQYAKNVAAYGKAIGNPYEYNYLIGRSGAIFEQAGDRVGGHCKNWNKQSYGILLMNGIDVPMTYEQIMAFRWLRDVLKWVQAVTPDCETVPHYRYRTTGCPGLMIADKPGSAWKSPTGQGRLGNLNGYLL